MKCQYEKVMKYKDCQDCKLKENCIEYYQSVLERVKGIIKDGASSKHEGLNKEQAQIIEIWNIVNNPTDKAYIDKIDGR